jgi:hypothetical protein
MDWIVVQESGPAFLRGDWKAIAGAQRAATKT